MERQRWHELSRRALAAAAVVVTIAAPAGAALLHNAAPAGAAPKRLPGDELWRRAYDGGSSAVDSAHAEALSPDGRSLYVVGSVTRAGHTDDDLAVMKYTSGGASPWLRTFDGPAHQGDTAYAVVVDSHGNVYVGGTVDSGPSSDFAVIKYDPAGHRKWVRAYDGPAHSNEWAAALALDGRGAVYIAGISYGFSGAAEGALVKYSPGGHRLWARRYASKYHKGDEFTALAIDNRRGAVYVGGTTAAVSADWLVVKYTFAGARTWVRTRESGWNYDDRAYALALAPGGGVYQAGFITHHDNPDPLRTWAEILRWSSAGKLSTTDGAAEHGYGGVAQFRDVVADRYGLVHAAGWATSPAGDNDAIVTTYNPRTHHTKTAWFDVAGLNDAFLSAACDASGNVYAAGYTDDTSVNGLGAQYLTVKFTRAGAVAWSWNTMESWGTLQDVATDVVVRGGTRAGVYVTGGGESPLDGSDWLTLKYQP